MMKDILKQLRNARGLTQIEIAEQFNVSQSTIASWESGKRRPDLDYLPVIADFYGVSVNYLYGDDNTKADDDADVIRERLRRDPSYKLLFDAASKATPEHLRAAAAMLKSLEPQEVEN